MYISENQRRRNEEEKWLEAEAVKMEYNGVK